MIFCTFISSQINFCLNQRIMPCPVLLLLCVKADTMPEGAPAPQDTCRLSWFVSQNSAFKGSIEIVHFGKIYFKNPKHTKWVKGPACPALLLCMKAVGLSQCLRRRPGPQDACRLSWFASQNSAFKGSMEMVHLKNSF